DRRQKLLALRLGPEAKEQRSGLAVGDPVGGHRSAGGEHLLEHHVSLQRASLVTAITRGPRHRDPAARSHLATELTIETAPGVRAQYRRGVTQLLTQERAHVRAQRLGLRRQIAEGESESLHAHAYVSRVRSSTKSPCVSCGCTQATSARRPSTRTPACFRRSTP